MITAQVAAGVLIALAIKAIFQLGLYILKEQKGAAPAAVIVMAFSAVLAVAVVYVAVS